MTQLSFFDAAAIAIVPVCVGMWAVAGVRAFVRWRSRRRARRPCRCRVCTSVQARLLVGATASLDLQLIGNIALQVQGVGEGRAQIGWQHMTYFGRQGLGAVSVVVMDRDLFDKVVLPAISAQYEVRELSDRGGAPA